MGLRSTFLSWLQQGSEPTPRRRMYEGATISRLTNDWVTSGTSADSELWSSLRMLRNRARQLARDNDYASQALRLITANVIGQGIPFQAQVKLQRGGGRLDKPTNDAIEDLWKRWGCAEYCHTAGKLTFAEIQRLALRTCAESGEVFIRIVRSGFGGSPVPLALEVLEPDWIDDRMTGRTAENGNEIRMGIEVDQWSRPVAYWFLPKHPGDYLVSGTQQASSGRSVRVPAKDVIHLFRTDRPGQTRGVSWLASCIKRLHHLAGFEEAEVVRARAAASLMGFIQSPEGELAGDDVMDNERVQDFQPGVFRYLAPGETVNIPNMNTPDPQFEAFMRAMLRGMSAGLGISYSSISADMSQSNYSSSRLSLLEERDNWRSLQGWMIESFHQRIFNEWLDLAVLTGALNLPLYESKPELYRNVRWMPRGWGWVDPTKEVEAYKEAVRCGFTTLTQVIAEQGNDIDEVLLGLANEREQAQELGLTLDIDPGKVNGNGGTQAKPSGAIVPDDPYASADATALADAAAADSAAGGQN